MILKTVVEKQSIPIPLWMDGCRKIAIDMKHMKLFIPTWLAILKISCIWLVPIGNKATTIRKKQEAKPLICAHMKQIAYFLATFLPLYHFEIPIKKPLVTMQPIYTPDCNTYSLMGL